MGSKNTKVKSQIETMERILQLEELAIHRTFQETTNNYESMIVQSMHTITELIIFASNTSMPYHLQYRKTKSTIPYIVLQTSPPSKNQKRDEEDVECSTNPWFPYQQWRWHLDGRLVVGFAEMTNPRVVAALGKVSERRQGDVVRRRIWKPQHQPLVLFTTPCMWAHSICVGGIRLPLTHYIHQPRLQASYR